MQETTNSAKAESEWWQSSKPAAKKWGYRNIYALSISLGIVYTGYYGLVSLQSSINPRIGLISLALMFASAFIAAFASPTLLKLFGTKYTIFFGFFGMFLYTLANFYPSPYTLIPTSVIAGLTSRPFWAATFNHSANIAVSIAPVLKKSRHYLISKFSGILLAFYGSSYISGNLASALILFPYNQADDNIGFTNTSMSYDNTTENSLECDIDGSDIKKLYIYILISVYAVIQAIGILVLLVFVDQLPKDDCFFSTKKKLGIYLTQPLTKIFSLLKSVRMLLLAPLITLWGLEISFALGTFTEVYITDCFGTYQVGFTLMVLGASSAIMCAVCGRLSKYIPQFVMVFFGATLMFILLSFLLIWDRVPSYPVIFTFAIVWGIGDAIWSTQAGSMPGILFPKTSEIACSAIQVWLGFGYTVGYAMAELMPLKGQLCVILVMVVLTSICSFVIEITYLKRSPHLWCCSEEESDTSKLGEVAVRLSASNPIACGETNSENSVSANELNVADSIENESRTTMEVPGLAGDDEKGTGGLKPSLHIVSAENLLFEIYNRGFETNASPVLNRNILPTVLTLDPQPNALNTPPPLLSLFNREERAYSSSSLLQQSVKYSQSYMYALDNAVEIEYL